MKFISKNSEETKNYGLIFAQKLTSGTTILLYGDLGSGKTTFVKGFAAGLGIKDRILSPTFVLQRIHQVPNSKIKRLNHMDLYRIENPIEIKNLGIEEIVEDTENVNIIEWADRLIDFKPIKGFRIHFNYINENEREIEVTNL